MSRRSRAGVAVWLCLIAIGAGGKLRAEDAFPTGTISFFNAVQCPDGWGPFELANGRFVVPVPASAGIGATVGIALKVKEDPTHSHDAETTINLSGESFIAIAGCCNDSPAQAGGARLSGTAEKTSTGLPYVALLLCQKEAPPAKVPLPEGLLTFYGGLACPSGWEQPLGTQGRFSIGLPENGTPGIAFGGERPLVPQEERTHRHRFAGSLTTSALELAIGSGCCASGYGHHGTYNFSGETSDVSSNLPYIQLLQCQKRP